MPNGFFLNRLEISNLRINSPKLPVRQIVRSSSCPDLGRPLVNSFTLDSLNVSMFQLPKSAKPEMEPEMEPGPICQNNPALVPPTPSVISQSIAKECDCGIM